jgi:1,4-alpha-glucan branching enzyme
MTRKEGLAMARKKSVEFILEMPAAAAVSVAGTFNNWDASRNPMRKGNDGLWRCKLSVPTDRHEYRFVVDGQWISDPKASESVLNPHGGTNSVLEV